MQDAREFLVLKNLRVSESPNCAHTSASGKSASRVYLHQQIQCIDTLECIVL